MKKMAFLVGVLCSSSVFGQSLENDSTTRSADKSNAQLMLPRFELADKQPRLVDEMPSEVKHSDGRFLTLSIENDKFGNGADKDYTNGLRITYFNTSADQPFYVDWIDTITPTYRSNESTSSYVSVGHNLYSPRDITEEALNKQDRPFAAFLYGSVGLNTLTDRHIDNVELTLGWVGPSALGKGIQTEFHKLINADIPNGWDHQIKDEPGIMLSWERTWPEYWAGTINDDLFIRVGPHVGATVGNIYTYTNAGFTIDLTPKATRWQTQPVRVRPAIPGNGYFNTDDSYWSWMLFAGWDSRLVARNIFLDGNTFKNSHSVDRKWLVHDAALGATLNIGDWRSSYTINWRSKEFNSPLAGDQVFGAITFTYRF